MKITFLSVGEAFDEHLANTSLLVSTEKLDLLIDCGFSVPPYFWQHTKNPLDLTAIYITHLHGDHYFGLPQLLLRFYEHNRSKELIILGPKGIKEKLLTILDYAYSGLTNKLGFNLIFQELEADEEFSLSPLLIKTFQSQHPVNCLGIGILEGKTKIYYSGDGLPGQKARDFCKLANLVILETYTIDAPKPGHNSIKQAIDIATQCKMIALVHIQRNERKTLKQFSHLIDNNFNIPVFIPDKGSIIYL
ncbi:MAG: ribonuclease Z [Desulfonauticus sp.]|nr:ribonuclease Z [Desulfonauticus sp.]